MLKDKSTADEDPLPSNLVIHARRELELIGEDQQTIDGYLKVMEAFGDMDHSGYSAAIAIPVINELLQFKNLSPLTISPDEWMQVAVSSSGGVWQSLRNPEAFSHDAGRTYYLLSEGGSDKNPDAKHISIEVKDD